MGEPFRFVQVRHRPYPRSLQSTHTLSKLALEHGDPLTRRTSVSSLTLGDRFLVFQRRIDVDSECCHKCLKLLMPCSALILTFVVPELVCETRPDRLHAFRYGRIQNRRVTTERTEALSGILRSLPQQILPLSLPRSFTIARFPPLSLPIQRCAPHGVHLVLHGIEGASKVFCRR